MRLYISGPIEGVEDYEVAFNDAADWLVDRDIEYISPVELDDHAPNRSRDYYIARDAGILLEENTTGVLVLDGWMDSRGARLEVDLALQTGLKIYRRNVDELQEITQLANDIILETALARLKEIRPFTRQQEMVDVERLKNTLANQIVDMTQAPIITLPTGSQRQHLEERYDLISPIGLRRLALTYAEGAKKYDDHNWRKGQPTSVVLSHAIDHLFKYLEGDTSEDHLAHAAWGCFAQMEFEETHPELDDRWRQE